MHEQELHAVRQRWKDKQARSKEVLCPPAEAFIAALTRAVGHLLVTGATPADKAQALATLEHLFQAFHQQTTRPHTASLWSTHRCVPHVYADMQVTLQNLHPPPAPKVPTGEVVLGNEWQTGIPVALSLEARLRGLYMVGLNGSGKSNFLLEMMLQDITAGYGMCLLDPHGDLTNDILDRIPPEREDDVIVLDLLGKGEAWGLNIFACPDPTSDSVVTETIDFVLQTFAKIWGDMTTTVGLADMLRMVTTTFIYNPGCSMADVQRLLTDDTYRARLISNVNDTTVREFWELEYNPASASGKKQMRGPLLRRIRSFMTPLLYNIVAQRTNSVDFRAVMDTGKILLVQLDSKLEDVTSLLGTVLVGQLLMAALSRKDIAERKDRRPFFLYADEYQHFATPSFGKLIQEARKFNIATVMAHQMRYQLQVLGKDVSEAPFGAPNRIVFELDIKDAKEFVDRFPRTIARLEREAALSEAEARRLLRDTLIDSPKYTALARTEQGEYRIKAPFRPVPARLEHRERLRAASRKRYYRPVAQARQHSRSAAREARALLPVAREADTPAPPAIIDPPLPYDAHDIPPATPEEDDEEDWFNAFGDLKTP